MTFSNIDSSSFPANLTLPKERFEKNKGIILGLILARFLTVLGLVINNFFKEI
jgi:hypothetical protein